MKYLILILSILCFQESLPATITINPLQCNRCNCPSSFNVYRVSGTAQNTSSVTVFVQQTDPSNSSNVQRNQATVKVASDGTWSNSDEVAFLNQDGTVGTLIQVTATNDSTKESVSASSSCPPIYNSITSNMLVNNTFSRSEAFNSEMSRDPDPTFNFSNSRLGVEGVASLNSKVKLLVDDFTKSKKVVFAKVFEHRWYGVLPKLSVGEHTLTTVSITRDGNKIKLHNKFNNNTNNFIIINWPAHRIIRNTKPTVTGTTNPNSNLEVFIDDVSIGNSTANIDGKWNKKVPFELSQGNHTIKVISVDSNTSQALEQDTFLIDVSTFVKINDPKKDSTSLTARPVLSGKTNKNKKLIILVDGKKVGVIDDAANNWSFKLPRLKNGSHTAKVKAINDKGSTGTDKVEFNINATTQNITILNLKNKTKVSR